MASTNSSMLKRQFSYHVQNQHQVSKPGFGFILPHKLLMEVKIRFLSFSIYRYQFIFGDLV